MPNWRKPGGLNFKKQAFNAQRLQIRWGQIFTLRKTRRKASGKPASYWAFFGTYSRTIIAMTAKEKEMQGAHGDFEVNCRRILTCLKSVGERSSYAYIAADRRRLYQGDPGGTGEDSGRTDER